MNPSTNLLGNKRQELEKAKKMKREFLAMMVLSSSLSSKKEYFLTGNESDFYTLPPKSLTLDFYKPNVYVLLTGITSSSINFKINLGASSVGELNIGVFENSTYPQLHDVTVSNVAAEIYSHNITFVDLNGNLFRQSTQSGTTNYTTSFEGYKEMEIKSNFNGDLEFNGQVVSSILGNVSKTYTVYILVKSELEKYNLRLSSQPIPSSFTGDIDAFFSNQSTSLIFNPGFPKESVVLTSQTYNFSSESIFGHVFNCVEAKCKLGICYAIDSNSIDNPSNKYTVEDWDITLGANAALDSGDIVLAGANVLMFLNIITNTFEVRVDGATVFSANVPSNITSGYFYIKSDTNYFRLDAITANLIAPSNTFLNTSSNENQVVWDNPLYKSYLYNLATDLSINENRTYRFTLDDIANCEYFEFGITSSAISGGGGSWGIVDQATIDSLNRNLRIVKRKDNPKVSIDGVDVEEIDWSLTKKIEFTVNSTSVKVGQSMYSGEFKELLLVNYTPLLYIKPYCLCFGSISLTTGFASPLISSTVDKNLILSDTDYYVNTEVSLKSFSPDKYVLVKGYSGASMNIKSNLESLPIGSKWGLGFVKDQTFSDGTVPLADRFEVVDNLPSNSIYYEVSQTFDPTIASLYIDGALSSNLDISSPIFFLADNSTTEITIGQSREDKRSKGTSYTSKMPFFFFKPAEQGTEVKLVNYVIPVEAQEPGFTDVCNQVVNSSCIFYPSYKNFSYIVGSKVHLSSGESFSIGFNTFPNNTIYGLVLGNILTINNFKDQVKVSEENPTAMIYTDSSGNIYYSTLTDGFAFPAPQIGSLPITSSLKIEFSNPSNGNTRDIIFSNDSDTFSYTINAQYGLPIWGIYTNEFECSVPLEYNLFDPITNAIYESGTPSAEYTLYKSGTSLTQSAIEPTFRLDFEVPSGDFSGGGIWIVLSSTPLSNGQLNFNTMSEVEIYLNSILGNAVYTFEINNNVLYTMSNGAFIDTSKCWRMDSSLIRDGSFIQFLVIGGVLYIDFNGLKHRTDFNLTVKYISYIIRKGSKTVIKKGVYVSDDVKLYDDDSLMLSTNLSGKNNWGTDSINNSLVGNHSGSIPAYIPSTLTPQPNYVYMHFEGIVSNSFSLNMFQNNNTSATSVVMGYFFIDNVNLIPVTSSVYAPTTKSKVFYYATSGTSTTYPTFLNGKGAYVIQLINSTGMFTGTESRTDYTGSLNNLSFVFNKNGSRILNVFTSSSSVWTYNLIGDTLFTSNPKKLLCFSYVYRTNGTALPNTISLGKYITPINSGILYSVNPTSGNGLVSNPISLNLSATTINKLFSDIRNVSTSYTAGTQDVISFCSSGTSADFTFTYDTNFSIFPDTNAALARLPQSFSYLKLIYTIRPGSYSADISSTVNGNSSYNFNHAFLASTWSFSPSQWTIIVVQNFVPYNHDINLNYEIFILNPSQTNWETYCFNCNNAKGNNPYSIGTNTLRFRIAPLRIWLTKTGILTLGDVSSSHIPSIQTSIGYSNVALNVSMKQYSGRYNVGSSKVAPNSVINHTNFAITRSMGGFQTYPHYLYCSNNFLTSTGLMDPYKICSMQNSSMHGLYEFNKLPINSTYSIIKKALVLKKGDGFSFVSNSNIIPFKKMWITTSRTGFGIFEEKEDKLQEKELTNAEILRYMENDENGIYFEQYQTSGEYHLYQNKSFQRMFDSGSSRFDYTVTGQLYEVERSSCVADHHIFKNAEFIYVYLITDLEYTCVAYNSPQIFLNFSQIQWGTNYSVDKNGSYIPTFNNTVEWLMSANTLDVNKVHIFYQHNTTVAFKYIFEFSIVLDHTGMSESDRSLLIEAFNKCFFHGITIATTSPVPSWQGLADIVTIPIQTINPSMDRNPLTDQGFLAQDNSSDFVAGSKTLNIVTQGQSPYTSVKYTSNEQTININQPITTNRLFKKEVDQNGIETGLTKIVLGSIQVLRYGKDVTIGDCQLQSHISSPKQGVNIQNFLPSDNSLIYLYGWGAFYSNLNIPEQKANIFSGKIKLNVETRIPNFPTQLSGITQIRPGSKDRSIVIL